MDNHLLVFVSSIINGMEAERTAVASAIKAIPVTRPWLFEFTSASSLPLAESYLSKVRGCDIFVLLLKDSITDPVKNEVDIALSAKRPMLVFVAASAPPDLVTYAQSLGVKYATWGSPQRLASHVAEAVGEELIAGYRRHRVPATDLGGIAGFVDKLHSQQISIQILDDHITTTGPVATRGSAIAQGPAIAVSGSVAGNIIQVYEAAPGKGRLSKDDVRRILGEYLSWVRTAFDKARLFGLESTPVSRPTSSQRLTDLFVPVILRRFIQPKREEMEQVAGKSGLDATLAWRQLTQDKDRVGKDVSLDKLLMCSPRLAIVGGAGSGKSTVLAYLAATLAGFAQTGEPLPYRLPNRKPLIPLVVPLRYYRDYLEKCRSDPGGEIGEPRRGTLAGFIPWYLRRRIPILELSEDFFDRVLLGGGCLLMIDGLDEVTSREQRGQVREEVEALVTEIYPKNRVIVTAREAGYREEAVFSDAFMRLGVNDFDDGQIAALVENWCRRLYPEDVEGNRDKLVNAIRYINALRRERDLPPLVNSPLLTTMVVSVQWGETELPRERARLYDACVKSIIQAQYIPDDPARQTLVNWGGPWEEQRDWLSRIALAMHEGGRSGAAVREEQVRAILGPVLAASKLDTFLHAVRYRGGLFEERGEFFQFTHLTFQEFLAARLLAKGRTAAYGDIRPHIADPWWREALLLVYGYLRMDHPPAADDYLQWLTPEKQDDIHRLAGSELAASAVLEMERPDPDLRRRHAKLLAGLLTDRRLSAAGALRAASGRALARLGDHRPGVGVRGDGLPEIVWCEVPEGHFIMGNTEKTDSTAFEDAPQQQPFLSGFAVSMYPITGTQFQTFVQDKGYSEKWRKCWTEAGWRWKGNRMGRPEYRFHRPLDLPNQPAVNVSWYEAVAFCNWLTERLRAIGELTGEQSISLPTEAQWEKAARGVDGRRYPWGDRVTANHANYSEAGIGTTTTVGIFPQGESPYGVLDMSGNVWEWCLTKWRAILEISPEDDAVEGRATRVVRGGSYLDNAERVRCAFRDGASPSSSRRHDGFRVVLLPPRLRRHLCPCPGAGGASAPRRS